MTSRVCPPLSLSVTSVGYVRQVFDLSTNLPADEAGIDLAALQAAQMTDADATQLMKQKGLSFSFVMFKDVSLLCDISTPRPRPIVPADFRRQAFMSIHNLSHENYEETTHAAMGIEGDAGGHIQVVQGVRPLPGVQGHKAHRP